MNYHFSFLFNGIPYEDTLRVTQKIDDFVFLPEISIGMKLKELGYRSNGNPYKVSKVVFTDGVNVFSRNSMEIELIENESEK